MSTPPDPTWPPPAPPGEDTPAEAEPEGLLETAIGVITSPVATMRSLTAAPRLGWAFAVLVAVGILYGIANYAVTDVQAAWFEGFEDPAFTDPAFERVMAATLAFLTPFFVVAGVAFHALILHGIALLFKGRGAYKGMFVGLSFATIPLVFATPAALLAVVLGMAGLVLWWLATFGLSIWSFVLSVFAVRENYGLTTGKAVGVVLVPVAIGILLVILLVVFLVFLFFVAVEGF
jgi:hypothetical protein